MSHTPYGYVIRDGAAYIDEEQAEKVRKLFAGYISGRRFSVPPRKQGFIYIMGALDECSEISVISETDIILPSLI